MYSYICTVIYSYICTVIYSYIQLYMHSRIQLHMYSYMYSLTCVCVCMCFGLCLMNKEVVKNIQLCTLWVNVWDSLTCEWSWYLLQLLSWVELKWLLCFVCLCVAIVDSDVGFSVTVGIESSSTVRRLQVMPLMTTIKNLEGKRWSFLFLSENRIVLCKVIEWSCVTSIFSYCCFVVVALFLFRMCYKINFDAVVFFGLGWWGRSLYACVLWHRLSLPTSVFWI